MCRSRLPTGDDPLTFAEQDELFLRAQFLRPGHVLLESELENILRLGATLRHYRGWLWPELDQTMPARVRIRGIDYLREEKSDESSDHDAILRQRADLDAVRASLGDGWLAELERGRLILAAEAAKEKV